MQDQAHAGPSRFGLRNGGDGVQQQQSQEEDDFWPPLPTDPSTLPLTQHEYQRYGRQMILPGFGLPSQLKLKRARVLVVGAGGLGCPAVQFLASAGVGNLTVMDADTVERSNLARQVLHTEDRIGINKAESVQLAVQTLNPHVAVTPLTHALTPSNALAIVQRHDLVLDCTDNPLTRYLINDACVLTGTILVSGAAQGVEGQLLVLNRPSAASAEKGPCYRCLFPQAPSPSQVTNCEDGGVIGTITGLVGVLQAQEAIKLLAGFGVDTGAVVAVQQPTMLLISPFSGSASPFRTIKLRPRRKDCRVCGIPSASDAAGKITDLESEDYISFCGLKGSSSSSIRGDTQVAAIAVEKFSALADAPLVLDVRTAEEFGIVHLPGPRVLNLPYDDIRRDASAALRRVNSWMANHHPRAGTDPVTGADEGSSREVYVVCKRGNDSSLSAALLNHEFQRRRAVDQSSSSSGGGGHPTAIDVKGTRVAETGERMIGVKFIDVRQGLTAWSQQVDAGFPMY